MSNVTVLGATGGIGRAISTELATRGHQVTAVNRVTRSPLHHPIRTVTADLRDRDQAIAATAGADVVVVAVGLPYREWDTGLPQLVDNARDGAIAAGARVVLVDNLYAYGDPDGPITEATPEAPTSRKGVIRRDIARGLLEAHAAGRVRVTIGRLSDYYGPGATNSMLHSLAIEPATRGKRPKALLDADQLHTFHYLPDVARAFATLVEHPAADGRVWIVPAAPPVTQRELMTEVGRQLGGSTEIGRISPAMLAVGGVFDRQIRETRELASQWTRPFVTDGSAFEATFGALATTAHGRAIAETIAVAAEQRDPVSVARDV